MKTVMVNTSFLLHLFQHLKFTNDPQKILTLLDSMKTTFPCKGLDLSSIFDVL